MTILETIAARAGQAGLPFLLAGGHAVIAHGHPRTTFDLDLIVRREDREQWLILVQTLQYSLCHEGPTFLQFNPTNPQLLPLDLMFVNQETFAKLTADAVPGLPSVTTVKIVSLRHLLALKCHAIKHGHAGRIVKDMDDVIRLVQANRVDMNAADVRDLLLKPAQQNCMKKSNASKAGTETAALEFPDWSGMDESSSRLSVQAAFQLCEQYSAWFPDAAQRWMRQRPPKCLEEFTL